MMSVFRPESRGLLCVLLGTVVLLGGCKSLSSFHLPRWHKSDPAKQLCEDNAAYLKAQSVPAVRVGEGLTPANTRNAIKIPEVAAEAHARTEQEGCLDRPPSFESGAKAKPAVSAKPKHDAPGN